VSVESRQTPEKPAGPGGLGRLDGNSSECARETGKGGRQLVVVVHRERPVQVRLGLLLVVLLDVLDLPLVEALELLPVEVGLGQLPLSGRLLGELAEFGVTKDLFTNPRDKRTEDYITGRFG
jgi:hypothetical protein